MITILVGMVTYVIIHSLLAGSDIKKVIYKRFGERAYYGLYRISYNIIAVVTIVPILIAIYFDANRIVWVVPGGWLPITLVIQAIGVIGVLISLLQIDLGQFLGLSQLRAYLIGAPLPLPTEPLQVRGTYALVRHPLYFFSILAIWPVPTMTEGLLMFNILATCYFLLGSLLEERRMVRIFGRPYIDYQQRVPWLIPIPRSRW